MQIIIHCGGLSVYSNSIGGSETAAVNVAKELTSMGHKVKLFSNVGETRLIGGAVISPIGRVSEAHPMGELFDQYAMSTPHDVLIAQRNPSAFIKNYASKSRYLWLHDVPDIRYVKTLHETLINTDGVFVVSEYHKNLVVKTYKINPNKVYNIKNGVDAALYNNAMQDMTDGDTETCMIFDRVDETKFNMLYSSCPERGLIELVEPGGIMETLAADKNNDGKYHLHVCAYHNPTEAMRDYHAYLNERCEALDNVTVHGELDKEDLVMLQLCCDLAIYPTTWAETSCITAIEAMHAGLPMLTSDYGALPETTKGSGTILLDLKDGKVVQSKFVAVLKSLTPVILEGLIKSQRAAALQNTWVKVTNHLVNIISSDFSCVSNGARAREMMRNGDIHALKEFMSTTEDEQGVLPTIKTELELYDFMDAPNEGGFPEHYQAYYSAEDKRGVDYGQQDLSGDSRFEYVSQRVADAVAHGAKTVLDYGCAHGAYLNNLALRFPDTMFVGIDINKNNAKLADDWGKESPHKNVRAYHGRIDVASKSIESLSGAIDLETPTFDIILACEVLEHVNDYQSHIDILNSKLSEGGRLIVSTPYGPWESLSFKKTHPYRMHIHHFDQQDLAHIFKQFDGLGIANVPATNPVGVMKLGCYVITMSKTTDAVALPYLINRKIGMSKGRETVSVCMLVKGAEKTLLATLESIVPIADELVIGFDCEREDEGCTEIVERFAEENPQIAYVFARIKPVLETGFDVARNTSVENASGDWILWIDADEVLVEPEALRRYTKANMFDAFVIEQMHFSLDPPGMTVSDKPMRLFRRNVGIRFFGVVHEHPEIALNQGVDYIYEVQTSKIAHYGYTDHATRKARFKRNHPLLIRDRKKYPNRAMGKFLWIRDLSQLNQEEYEFTGSVSEGMIERADEGIKLFRAMVAQKQMRYVIKSLPFVSDLFDCKHNGATFNIDMVFSMSHTGDPAETKPMTARFGSENDVRTFLSALTAWHLKRLSEIKPQKL